MVVSDVDLWVGIKYSWECQKAMCAVTCPINLSHNQSKKFATKNKAKRFVRSFSQIDELC